MWTPQYLVTFNYFILRISVHCFTRVFQPEYASALFVGANGLICIIIDLNVKHVTENPTMGRFV